MSEQDEIARLRALWCEEKSKSMTFHAEIERLRAEVAALKAERDEARRLYCHAQAATILDARPEAMAARLGWHCFKEAK